jgi:hypothetical protein
MPHNLSVVHVDKLLVVLTTEKKSTRLFHLLFDFLDFLRGHAGHLG